MPRGSVGRRTAWAAVALLLAACGGGSPAREQIGVGGVDGAAVFAANCAVCHGDRGQGGIGPAFTDALLADFPRCADHLQWVGIGSLRWRDEVGPTVGASDREITGVMPGFQDQLNPDELQAVVMFERVRFAGADLAEAGADCAG